jgi:uncharacterized SCP-like protein
VSPGPRRRTDVAAGREALGEVLAAIDVGDTPMPADLRTACRFLLEQLAADVPGASVEVRVPPHGVVQCAPSGPGPRHTRGTPPNVVETDPLTWVRLATGRLAWADAVHAASVRASGERADLSPALPVQI